MQDAISLKDFEAFFKFLGPDNEIYTFSLFDRVKNTPVQNHGTFYLRWQEVISHKLYELGTVHLVLNRTKLTGRKLADIESVRCLAVDIDTVTERKQIKKIVSKYNAGLVVESSPGKFHLYWKADPSLPLDVWSNVQLGLAYGLGGDFALAQQNKMLRVPGVMRIKDEAPYIPTIQFISANPVTLNFNGIAALFPEIHKWIELGKEKQKAQWEALRRVAIRVNHDNASINANNSPLHPNDYSALGRNNALYCIGKELVSRFSPGIPAISFDQLLNEITEINRYKFTPPLYTSEVLNIAKSCYSKGLAKWESKKSTYEAYMQKLEGNTSEVEPGTNQVSTRLEPSSNQVSTIDRVDQKIDASTDGYTPDMSVTTNVVEPVTEVTTAVAAPLTNGLAKTFQYDYSDPILRNNRFNELGIVARIQQRFRKQMLKVDKSFYAFCMDRNTWEIQTLSHYPELFGFYKDAVLDVIHDPQFVAELCLTKDGQVSPDKHRKAQEKYLSSRMVKPTIAALLNSEVTRANRGIFDSAPELFHMKGGVVNMLTGEITAAKAEQYLLARSDIEIPTNVVERKKFQENCGLGVCPFWTDFLGEVFRDNTDPADMVRFMQELFGYSLGASITEQKIFCHYGGGANGKSKVLACLRDLVGSYAAMIDSDELAKNKKSFSTKFERFGAKVEGKRLAIVDDIDTETVWNEGFVKSLTGEYIRARAEYEQSRVVINRCKMHMGLNVPPSPEAENYGILRRLCVIPYARRFSHNARISDAIDAGIKKNKLAILGWAIAGFRRVVAQGGIIYPKETDVAVEEYRQDHFGIETAIEQLFELTSEDHWEFISDLVNDVNNYLNQSGNIERTTPEKLSRILLQRFGKRSSKVWCSRRKNSFPAFQLKLKFERQNSLAQL